MAKSLQAGRLGSVSEGLQGRAGKMDADPVRGPGPDAGWSFCIQMQLGLSSGDGQAASAPHRVTSMLRCLVANATRVTAALLDLTADTRLTTRAHPGRAPASSMYRKFSA